TSEFSKSLAVTFRTAVTTTVSSSLNPSVVGQPVTFTATVRPAAGGGTPSGTVLFRTGPFTLGAGALVVQNGVAPASFTTAELPVGPINVYAESQGDGTFSPGVSDAVPQVVKPADTTTSVGSPANPSTAGQAVTFTATVGVVAPGAGTP